MPVFLNGGNAVKGGITVTLGKQATQVSVAKGIFD
jgi:hypothetical protein